MRNPNPKVQHPKRRVQTQLLIPLQNPSFLYFTLILKKEFWEISAIALRRWRLVAEPSQNQQWAFSNPPFPSPRPAPCSLLNQCAYPHLPFPGFFFFFLVLFMDFRLLCIIDGFLAWIIGRFHQFKFHFCALKFDSDALSSDLSFELVYDLSLIVNFCRPLYCKNDFSTISFTMDF